MTSIGYLLLLILCFILCAVHGEKSEGKKSKYTITDEVWFDIVIKKYEDGEDYHGRFVVGVFGDATPITALNFVTLARGMKRPHTGKTLSYKKSPVHRIVKDFVIQMGDVTKNDGSGGESIFGKTFADENFELSHRAKGYVAMANTGPDSNGSQFFITLSRARWLDGKHVVFGKVIRGMDVLKVIEEIKTKENTGIPTKEIKIEDCGVESKTHTLSEEEMLSDSDLEL